MKRSQFSIEFGLLFAASLLVFLILLVLAYRIADDFRGSSERQKLESLGEGIRRDLVIAAQSGMRYEAELRLPDKIEGMQYGVTVDSDILVLNTIVDRPIMVQMPIPKINGTIVKGCNRIVKSGGLLNVNAC